MPNAAGLQLATQAQLAGVHAVLAGVVKAVGGGGAAGGVGHREVGQ